MKTVYLKYNPYTLHSELKINGENVSERSTFAEYLDGYRLQHWMEPIPSQGWGGLLAELQKVCNTDQIQLQFHGTALDCQDLEELVNQENIAKKHFAQITLTHENAKGSQQISQGKKLDSLKQVYQKVKNGPVPEFRTAEIDRIFQSAINSDFEIVVIAPMSSGKSTIINAMLGHDILPAINQATTAVITRIRDVDGKKNFTVTATDHHGHIICENEIATLERVTKLNGERDPEDPEKKRSRAKEILLEGDIASLPASGLHTVFVDTPGGNNAQNKEHQAVMDQAIYNEDKSMVLYVFNGTQVSTEDNARILERIAEAMKRSVNGKQSRDRFLFVANRMDDVDTDKESYDDMVKSITASLNAVGIYTPNLFLVSARTAKLIRMTRNGDPMGETDSDDLDFLTKKMSRDSRRLYHYSTLTARQKADMDAQVEALQKQYPDSKSRGIPGVAEIDSGIPALEAAIRDYLQKYALAIKLKQAQDAFMGKVRDKEILGSAERRWNESEDSFQEAKTAVDAAQKKLDNDKSLETTLAEIDKIGLDENLCWLSFDRFVEAGQDLSISKNQCKRMEVDEAKKAFSELKEQAKSLIATSCEDIEGVLKENVEASCNRILEEYRTKLKELDESGLLNIGGIQVKKLSGFQDSVFSTSKIEKYTKTEEKSRRVKDSGFTGGIKRFFGGLFSNDDWGYHTEYWTDTYVKFDQVVRICISELQVSFKEQIEGAIVTAQEEVMRVKQAAKEQSKALSKMIQALYSELAKKVKSRENLKKALEADKVSFDFAKEIINDVETILDV